MNQELTANTTSAQLIITQLINAWAAQNKAVTAFFNKYPDEEYSKQVAPDRNRAIYLLGHLIAVNDAMIPMLMLGEKLFPELEAPFITNPDKAITEMPPLAELRQQWDTLNVTLTDHFQKMTIEDWMGRHSLVSEADFANAPLRNKLNILISRTNHQAYHSGQINLLNPAS